MEDCNRTKIKTVRKNEFLLRQGKKGRFKLSMTTVFGEYDAGIVETGESTGELKIF